MLKGLSVNQSKEVATAAMEKLGLGQYSQVLCGDLSGGNKRKVCIGVALTGSPQLVLMDEPTSGLDPGSRRQVGRMHNDVLRVLWETQIEHRNQPNDE